MPSRIVGFTTHRMPLGLGDHGEEWLEIRDKLSYYEQQALSSAMMDVDVQATGDYNMKADIGKYFPAILSAYIVGWQLFDDDGTLLPFSKDALARLDTKTCEDAIAHINAMAVEKDSEKKVIAIGKTGTRK